jgi:hypothetical protein
VHLHPVLVAVAYLEVHYLDFHLRSPMVIIHQVYIHKKRNKKSNIVCDEMNSYSGFGGSLASNVPSFRVLSLDSSGSLSESDVSKGSSGLLLLGVICFPLIEEDGGRLLRGGASGCGCCDCEEEIPNSFN